jgi:hypothetical protein
MAAQTFSTSLNIDDSTKSGLNNGDDITINTDATLTRNSDSRWGQQAAVVGSITIDATTGGKIHDDGTTVWWVPFDASTGNVPSLGTVDVADCTSVSGATGEFLGVWTALGVAPTAAASAMPSSGFVKFRSVSAAFVDNDVVTLPGSATITVNSTTGGQRGWLHLVHGEAEGITVPRLGEHEIEGDWFYLGTAAGTDDETFQFYVADRCPAIDVETGSGTNVWETWPAAGGTRSTQTNRAATDARGKVFKNNADGTCVFGIRTGITFGKTLPAGARLRVPNIHISSSTSADWTANTRNTALATRIDWSTFAAGAIKFSKVSVNGYIYLAQAYSAELTDVYALDQIYISECATEVLLTRCTVGVNDAVNAVAFIVASCFSGVTMTDCTGLSYEIEAGATGIAITDCDAVTISGGKYMAFGDNTPTVLTRGANYTGVITLTRVTNSELTDVVIIGAALRVLSCTNITITDMVFAHSIENITTSSTLATSAINISAASTNISVYGYGGNYASIANIHPYNAIVTIDASYNTLVQGIATKAAPYDCGSADACAGIIATTGNSSGTVARRCYCSNARSGAAANTNSDVRMTLVDVWGDGADTGLILNALDTNARGLRSATPTTGATAVYGTSFYDTFVSTTGGYLVLLCNEPTVLSGTKLVVTGGTPEFSATGRLLAPTVGDEATWEMDYFWLGITRLANAAPTFNGTNSANHIIEFQYDTGSGWSGTWLTATGTNLYDVGAITPTTGIKLKVRVRCTTASTTNAVINICVAAVTDATSYLTEYPLPKDSVASVLSILAGSRIQVYNVTTATEIANEVVTGTSWALAYDNGDEFSTDDVVRIRLTYQSGTTAARQYTYNTVAGSTGWIVYAAQVMLSTYASLGYDGSAATEFTLQASGVIEVDINDPDGTNEKRKLVAWFYYAVTTEVGIRDFFGRMELQDAGNAVIYQDGFTALELDNTSSMQLVLTDDTFRLYTDDASAWIKSTSTGGYGITSTSDKVYTVCGGLAPSEAQIKSWVMAAEIIPGWTMARLLRKVGAMTISKSSGNTGAGGTVVFRTLGDDADEMSATVDANGNRTTVTQGS